MHSRKEHLEVIRIELTRQAMLHRRAYGKEIRHSGQSQEQKVTPGRLKRAAAAAAAAAAANMMASGVQARQQEAHLKSPITEVAAMLAALQAGRAAAVASQPVAAAAGAAEVAAAGVIGMS